MQKFHKSIALITAICYYAFISNVYASLPPMSLTQMYSKATSGNVPALRAAVQRGMNIDIMDRNGNTGLCYAIYRKDATAYNAFRAAGSNPRHGCTNNIPTKQYDSFMARSDIADINGSTKAAYGLFNQGEFIVDNKVWWAAGALLLIGGGIALASGGGGGSKSPAPSLPPSTSLGGIAGTKTPSQANSSYTGIMINSTTNTVNGKIVENDNETSIPDKANPGTEITKYIKDILDFTTNIKEFGEYIRVGMKTSVFRELITNSAIIDLKDATAGLVAVGTDNQAINNGELRINAQNGTIGMIASENALATNNNTIQINFSGTDNTNQVIGMYADSMGEVLNNGHINTTSAQNADKGTIIGMETRLTDHEDNPMITKKSSAINSTAGEIKLTNSKNDGVATSLNLIGMGSFLDKDFLDGIKTINNAGYSSLENHGKIILQSNLSGGSQYSSNINKGDAGIIGMISDAHSIAHNASTGSIKITLIGNANDYNNAQAGMLSTHGGKIDNAGSIEITGGTGGYGMVAVSGAGTSSQFDTIVPNISNSGAIKINSIDGFGIASYHPGFIDIPTLISNQSTGNIHLLSKGTGIYSNTGNVNNFGTILLNSAGDGIKVVTDQVLGHRYDINSTIIQNTNSIIINNALNSSGILAEAGTITNTGNIKLENLTNTTANSNSYGIKVTDGVADNLILNLSNINMNIFNAADGTTKTYGIYSEKVNIENGLTGQITINEKGTGIYSTDGKVNNFGNIRLLNGGVGIETQTGHINQKGNVIITGTEPGIGIKTSDGVVINEKLIDITSNSSIGIDSNNNVTNTALGIINVTGKDGIGINLGENGTALNQGAINITGGVTLAGSEHYGIKSSATTEKSIINNGVITLTGDLFTGDANKAYGIYSTHGNIENNNTIIFQNFYGVGIHSTAGIVRNSSSITSNHGGIGISGETNSQISNLVTGIINITSTPSSSPSYGMKSDKGVAAINRGTIMVDVRDSFGIHMIDGIASNLNLITMKNSGSTGMYGEGTNIATNSNIINIEGATSSGMKTKAGTATNDLNINLLSTSDGSYGMYSLDGGSIFNRGTIKIDSKNSYGMYTTAASSKAINNDDINLNSATFAGYGMYANDSGEATNRGNINIIGTDGYGMYAKDSGIAINESAINFSATSSGYGMYGDNGVITNSGTLNMLGANSYAMYGKNGATLSNSSDITMNGASSYGMYDNNGGTLNNTSNITMNGLESSGMYGKSGATLINSSSIIMNGLTNYGMYAISSNIDNSGTIQINANDSYGIYANASTVTNSGTIKTTGSNSYGIHGSNGATINNTSEITLSGSDSYGMYSDNSALTNNGPLNINGGSSYGMYAKSGGTINNLDTITLSGANSYGMYVINGASSATNTGEIILANTASGGYGMYADAGLVTNNGTINMDRSAAYGMYAKSSGSAKNTSIIDLKTTANGGSAMYSENGHLTNDGTLNIHGSSAYAMWGKSGGTITNNNTIALNGASSHGVYAQGGTIGNNTGTITSVGAGSYGMYALGGKIKNSGIIQMDGANSYGMYGRLGATISNTGSISINNSSGYGIYVSDSSQATNSGTITLNSSGTGMYAQNSSQIHNAASGVINVNAGMRGMFATGSGSSVYNQGEIRVGGLSVIGEICTTALGGCGNWIVLQNNAEFINGGLTITPFSMNFSAISDGTGKTYVAKGGTFEAPDFSGTVYADSSIVAEGFETQYTNEKSFVGEDKGIELASGSYMFTSRLIKQDDGSHDIIMNMKDMNDIVDDSSVADFLSNNYSFQRGETLFALMKSANNQNDFGKVVNSNLGLDFFPSLSRQNFEAIKSLDRSVNQSIFSNDNKKERSAITGYDFYNKNHETSGVVSGYKENAHSVYGVVEKRYNENLSYGLGGAISKINSKYSNGSKRDDALFQIFSPLKYRLSDLTLLSTAKLGIGFGDYERHTNGAVYKSDTLNYIYGITNEARKDINLNLFTLEPTAEFNILGIYQDKTKEKNQITVKSSNNVSIEAGLGLYAKKDFKIDEDNSINLRVGGTYYQELNSSYENSTASMNGMIGDYNMKGYEAQRYRGVATTRAEYKHKDIKFFTSASKLIEKDGSYDFKAGIAIEF